MVQGPLTVDQHTTQPLLNPNPWDTSSARHLVVNLKCFNFGPMTELVCPVCRSDSYLNPNIKIFISPCFHRICEQCLYKIFAHGYAPCPECGTPLRRINFISSTFEDIEVEREIKIRKLMNRHFVRSEDEFSGPVEYNNYLEQYEDTVFELLELKNDSLVKERINALKNSNCLLVPGNQTSQKREESAPDVKRARTEENSWFMFKEKVSESILIDSNVDIPGDFMIPFEAGGLSKSLILGYIAYSLIDNV